jgi:hypothetical protein
VRGTVGASPAIQAALRDAADRSPAALAAVLAAVVADGDPMRDVLPLFDAPDRAALPVPARSGPAGSGDDPRAAAGPGAGAVRRVNRKRRWQSAPPLRDGR